MYFSYLLSARYINGFIEKQKKDYVTLKSKKKTMEKIYKMGISELFASDVFDLM